MAAALLPVVAIRRVLLPGTGATLPIGRAGLCAGSEVVAVLGRDGAGGVLAGTVGTIARVAGVCDMGDRVTLVRLWGERLVRIAATREVDEEWWGEVCEVEDGGEVPTGLVALAEEVLRRYMAARAEAGEGGDVHVRLSRDPVPASHEVASHLQVSWPELQDVLEAGGAAERLRGAMAVMERETGLLQRLLGREGE